MVASTSISRCVLQTYLVKLCSQTDTQSLQTVFSPESGSPQLSNTSSNHVCAACCSMGRASDEGRPATANLVACMDRCSRQCQVSLPEQGAVHEVWKRSNKFSHYDMALGARATENEDAADAGVWANHSALVDSVLKLLSAVLIHTNATDPASHSSRSSSSSSGKDESRLAGKSHSQAAAVSRAARVLQQRRITQQEVFPINLLLLLASTLQVLATLFDFLKARSYNTSHCSSDRSINLARLLFGGGNLVESVHSASMFLLRCVRQRQPPQQPPVVEESPSFKQVQRAACQSLCEASSGMFNAIPALAHHVQLIVLSAVPARFFCALGCVACEGLPADDPNLYCVTSLHGNCCRGEILDASLFSLMHCSSMQTLCRRRLPYAVKGRESLEDVLDMLTSHHPEIVSDPLLALGIRYCHWWPSSFLQQGHSHRPRQRWLRRNSRSLFSSMRGRYLLVAAR